mmetsp:Transcript_91616/g.144838  ORF Transcript_91616/g.144838 Transcript_91616/m.144838 type:complete len:942 (+) Transcript_91616:2-2827(+)
MTQEEIASVVIYTMECNPREGSVYYAMNKALRNKNREAVKSWRNYIWYFLHALKKIPPSKVMTLYRGSKCKLADMGLDLDKGDDFTWSAFSSAATTVDVMNQFLGTTGDRTLVTITMDQRIGRLVTDFSLFPDENEVLLPPNVSFEFVSKFECAPGFWMVQAQQVESLDELLDISEPTDNTAQGSGFNAVNQLKPTEEKVVSSVSSKAYPTDVNDAPDVRQFCEDLKLPPALATKLIENGFDHMSTLNEITVDDLKEMEVAIGHRRKILNRIETLKKESDMKDILADQNLQPEERKEVFVAPTEEKDEGKDRLDSEKKLEPENKGGADQDDHHGHKRYPELGDEVEALVGVELKVDGKDYYRGGDRGRVCRNHYIDPSDNIERFEVAWYRSGLVSTMKKEMWLRNFMFIGNPKTEAHIGDRMKALPSVKLEVDGKDYYKGGDVGIVSKKRYTTQSDGIDRFEVKWNRTGLTSTMKCDLWLKNFEFIQEPKIGDEMVSMSELDVDGKEYYKPGDLGRVTKENYTTASDGIDRFEITWYRTGLTSTMKTGVWRTYFKFTGNVAKKLPNLGDEVQSLPGSELSVSGKEYYLPGDRGRVSKESYTTASDGIDRIEITWFRTGLTSTMKSALWLKYFFFIGRAKSLPQIGDEMRCLPLHDLIVDGKEYYRPGDEGRVTKETYTTASDGIARFEVTWYRTGMTSTMKVELWIKYFLFTGRSKEVPKIGDRVEALPGITLEVGGKTYYQPGDRGNVSKETYTTASDGIDRFEVKWDRTGLTSTMKRNVWLKNFRYIHEPKLGDEVECLPSIELQVDGKDYYKEGDKGRVCKDTYKTESDGKFRFEVSWYRTGLVSTMITDRWESNFKFTGKQKVLPSMGDEMQALPNIKLNVDGKDYYHEGDKGRVCKENYTASDGIDRFEVTWYRTGLTSTMKTELWHKNFRCVSQS